MDSLLYGEWVFHAKVDRSESNALFVVPKTNASITFRRVRKR